MSRSSNPERVAYVGRVPAYSTPPRFAGYVEVLETGQIVAEQDDPVTLADALEWANRHTPTVVLSYGVSGAHLFSAGANYYDGGDPSDPLPPWPPAAEVLAAIDAEVLSLRGVNPSNQDRLSVVEPLIQEPDESD